MKGASTHNPFTLSTRKLKKLIRETENVVYGYDSFMAELRSRRESRREILMAIFVAGNALLVGVDIVIRVITKAQ